jgi:hypothetical protein
VNHDVYIEGSAVTSDDACYWTAAWPIEICSNSRRRCSAKCLRQFGRIDVVCANPGISSDVAVTEMSDRALSESGHPNGPLEEPSR